MPAGMIAPLTNFFKLTNKINAAPTESPCHKVNFLLTWIN